MILEQLSYFAHSWTKHKSGAIRLEWSFFDYRSTAENEAFCIVDQRE
jgi:hypothetical protein